MLKVVIYSFGIYAEYYIQNEHGKIITEGECLISEIPEIIKKYEGMII